MRSIPEECITIFDYGIQGHSMNRSTRIPNKVLIWLFVIFYFYSLAAGIVFQKVLLQFLPGMVAPGASLTTDSAYFHGIAVSLANEISAKGWSVWSPFPNQYTSFNVALLGALYAIFGVNTLLAVPLNALFHALSGVLLYLIAGELSANSSNGKIAGLIASIIFIIFPSALNWYGQIHKDGFAIFGIFLYAYILVFSVKNYKSFSYYDVIKHSFYSFAAIFFIGIIRPYYLKPLLAFTLVLVGLSVWRMLTRSEQSTKILVFAVLTTLSVMANSTLVVIIGATEAQLGETYATSDSLEFVIDKTKKRRKPEPRGERGSGFCSGDLDGVLGTICQKYSEIEDRTYFYYSMIEDHAYLYYSMVEERLENNAKILAETRFKLNEYSKSVKSKSSIDINVNFHNLDDVISYVPRALQISIFAPFPDTWFDSFSPTRLIASAEMAVIYISLTGVLLVLFLNPRTESILLIILGLTFLVIYGLTIGNVGTLYRVRYAFEFLLVVLGVVGWCDKLLVANGSGRRLKDLSSGLTR